MPIEFNCRFCGAMIRVPDKAKGGKGKCPKCGQRITVPKKSTVKLPEPASELPFDLPKPAEVPAADPDEVVFREFNDESEAGAVVFGVEESKQALPREFPYESQPDPHPTKSSPRRKKKQQTDSVMLAILGFIVVAGLVLAAFIVVPLLTSEKITGELKAATAESLELPPASIDKSRIDLPTDELTTLLKKLEVAPAIISSSSTQITIFAKPEGLLFSVAPGSQHQFYRVDPTSNPAVRKYVNQHQSDFNELRLKQINESLTKFTADYQKALTKKSSGDSISAYRDTLAIPSLVKGLGHQVVAQYGRSVYRCVYEDSEGGLYFLLPAGVTEFEMKGREGSDGRVIAPLEIRVYVEGKITLPKMPNNPNQAKSDVKSKAKAEAKPSDSDEEGMNGKK